MSRLSLIPSSANRRMDSLRQLREDIRNARIAQHGCVRCPDCNADAVSPAGLVIHKRTSCIVIPGARERAANLIVDYLMRGGR